MPSVSRGAGATEGDDDVSKSALEESLLFAMRAVKLPEPVRELHPFWCCEHTKREHKTYTDGSGEWCRRCFFDAVEGDQHEYCHGRSWKCDFAWPDRRLIVEVEGGVYTQGRHVRPSGFTKDLEKYNALTEAGWKVLRFSRREVTSGEALNVIQRVLNEAAVSG